MTAPKVLSVHNFYRLPGGEDRTFISEAEILKSRGHEVVTYEESNERIGSGALTAVTSIWNQRSYSRLRAVARAERPDVAHLHNTFPRVSPAACYALRKEGVAIVQKLGNFRLLCPGALFMREGQACEECAEKRSLMPALRHKCYRGSLPATASVAAMLSVHRALGTWHSQIDIYIAPTEFVRRKFIENGFSPDAVVVKPHVIVPEPTRGLGNGGYALFVGRLSPEKGIDTMMDAWSRLSDIPLRIAGDGPSARIDWPAGVTWLGQQSRERTYELMQAAHVLIVPSTCYEIGPITVIEAFACGLPVIASGFGSMAERVAHMRTGLLFQPGDAEDLAHHVRWAFDHPEQIQAMRANARREFEDKYTAERNYKMLIAIYEQAIESAQRRRREHGAS